MSISFEQFTGRLVTVGSCVAGSLCLLLVHCKRAVRINNLLSLLPAIWLLAGCQSNEYLQKSEAKYGVGNSWYGSDLRVYHDALLSPNSMRLHHAGYIIGVEELHPHDPSFVTDADKRYVEHAITHVMRYGIPAGGGVSAASGCAIFSLLEPEQPEPDPAHGVFTHCRAADGEAAAAELHLASPGQRDSGDEPDDCARRSYERLDASKLKTLPIAQGEAIRRFHQSLCHQLANGRYSHIFVMVMGWNTNQSLAFKNFNSLVNNIESTAQAEDTKTYFNPLIIGVTWPSELNIGPWSVLPQELVHLASFFSKRKDSEDVGRYVLADVLINVLDARDQAVRRRAGSGATAPPIVMIGHSFGARALVNALNHPIIGAASSLNDRQSEIRRTFDKFTTADRLFLLQGAVEFGSLFAPDDMQLAGTIALGRPRVTMTASKHDSANSAAVWGYYTGTTRAFRQACEDPLNLEIWQSQGYHLDQIGCGIIDGKSAPYGFALCRSDTTKGKEEPGQTVVRPLDGNPVRYFDASRMINCDAPFTGGGAHSDVFRLETAQFLWREMQ